MFFNGRNQDLDGHSCPDSYALVRTWKATDNCFNSTFRSQTITVQDTQAPAFVIFPQDVNVECNAVPLVAVISTGVTATDNCDADVAITYLGQVRSDGTCPDSYTLTRTWVAADNCLHETTRTQTITVHDTQAPDFVLFPSDVTVECNAVPGVAAIGAGVTTSDNCDAIVAITYVGENRIDGICEDTYILKRTWTAADNCLNETTRVQTITVQDTQPPAFILFPDNATVECAAVPLVAVIGTGVTATDNCDAAVAITYVGEIRTDGLCPNAYTLFRTWKSVDNCQNETMVHRKSG